MSMLMNCGIGCMLLGIWGVIQLTIMGVLYTKEAMILLEDVEPHSYDNYDDFITKTKKNYSIVGLNCFLAAALYIIIIGVSYYCIRKARKTAFEKAKINEDDELSCTPHVETDAKKLKKKYIE